jgi:hypothetical protein
MLINLPRGVWSFCHYWQVNIIWKEQVADDIEKLARLKE